jgi:uncharacterized protein YuzE
MRYRFDRDKATVYFSETAATQFDRSQTGLVVGLDAQSKIASVTFVNPVKRASTDEVDIIVRYDADADALVIELDGAAYRESAEAPLGHVIDFNDRQEIVGVEILHASDRFSRDAIRQFSAAA